MLEVEGLEAGYGTAQVLFGVELRAPAGRVTTLLGRNGMGKTTTVRAVLGLVPPTAGRVRFEGHDLAGWPSHRIARAGIGLVPEGRQVFPNLSVRENLEVAARPGVDGARRWDLAALYRLFPALAERADHLGSQLSGGEQQMLAVGRALSTNPRLLVLDEATEGLAPRVRATIWAILRGLAGEGLSILVIDKDLRALLDLGDHHHVLAKGRVVWSGTSAGLRAEPDLVRRHIGV